MKAVFSEEPNKLKSLKYMNLCTNNKQYYEHNVYYKRNRFDFTILENNEQKFSRKFTD